MGCGAAQLRIRSGAFLILSFDLALSVFLARFLIASLDVGTSTVQTAVAEHDSSEGRYRLLGVGIAQSSGVRRGVVIDADEASSAVHKSVSEASRAAGVPVRSLYVVVGGARITVSSSRGVVAVSRADGEVTPEDIRRAVSAAETFIPRNPNREILHMIPREFRVDQEDGVKNPAGMHGVRLEADTLIIECFSPALKTLFKCVEQAGFRVADYVFSPLAASDAVLTKRQKELGTMLLDVGGGTASFIVFEEGVPIHAGVFALGGDHITHDVAIGFRTQVDVAERIKTVYGSCVRFDHQKRNDTIQLAEFVPDTQETFTKKDLSDIIEARLSDIFELTQRELKKINRKELLPGGIVLVGGGALLPGLCDVAKEHLKLPVELGVPDLWQEGEDASSYAAVLGALKWAERKADASGWKERMFRMRESTLIKWVRSFLP